MTIVEFITARQDEREAVAKRAAACDLVQHDGYEPGDWSWLPSYGQPQPSQIALIDHQAANDPKWVLADVAAKRRILERHGLCATGVGYCQDRGSGYDGEPGCDELADLAAIDADHPDYLPKWAA